MYLIPFLSVSKEVKHALVILAILLAYVAKYLVYSILFKWGNSFVQSSHRARFSAGREIVSLISGIVFTLVVSRTFDSFEASGNLNGGFLFISIIMVISNVSGFVCMLLMKKEDAEAEKESKKPLSDVLHNTLGNESFRHLLVFTIIWDSALLHGWLPRRV